MKHKSCAVHNANRLHSPDWSASKISRMRFLFLVRTGKCHIKPPASCAYPSNYPTACYYGPHYDRNLFGIFNIQKSFLAIFSQGMKCNGRDRPVLKLGACQKFFDFKDFRSGKLIVKTRFQEPVRGRLQGLVVRFSNSDSLLQWLQTPWRQSAR